MGYVFALFFECLLAKTTTTFVERRNVGCARKRKILMIVWISMYQIPVFEIQLELDSLILSLVSDALCVPQTGDTNTKK